MKNINLNIWERLQLTMVISKQQGDWNRGRILVKLLDKLVLSEEEEKEIKLSRINMSDGSQQLSWEDKEKEYPITFENAEYDILYVIADSYGEWKPDKRVMILQDKMRTTKEDSSS
jgi:hypothetical protein